MSLMFRWVIIYNIWLCVTGCVLFGVVWFVTGSHLIMEWHIISRVVFGSVTILCAAAMTVIARDVEDSVTQRRQQNPKSSEIEPR